MSSRGAARHQDEGATRVQIQQLANQLKPVFLTRLTVGGRSRHLEPENL